MFWLLPTPAYIYCHFCSSTISRQKIDEETERKRERNREDGEENERKRRWREERKDGRKHFSLQCVSLPLGSSSMAKRNE